MRRISTPWMQSRQSGRTACRAFTLVEVLATITIIAAVGSVASVTLVSALDGYIDAATQSQLHSELSIAVDRMDRELRKIARDPIVAGAPNIASVGPTSITWNADYRLSLSAGLLLFEEDGSAPAV